VRDHQILHAVGRMKFATTTQLTALFFGHPATCSRRLAKLVSLKLLNVFVPHLNAENVYALSPRGLESLLENDEPE
jgi:hypothetical protein